MQKVERGNKSLEKFENKKEKIIEGWSNATELNKVVSPLTAYSAAYSSTNTTVCPSFFPVVKSSGSGINKRYWCAAS
jgi:hypothetical protein